MAAQIRPYLFYDTAVSLCTTCYRRIDAKIVFSKTETSTCSNAALRTASSVS